MGEVVDLAERREPELTLWRCDCGCITHYVRSDGELQCANCDEIVSDNGFWRLPEGQTREIESGDGPETSRHDMGDSDAALDAVLRFVNAQAAACVVVLQENGELLTWGNEFKTRARRGWLRRRLDAARKMLVEE